MNSMLDYIGSMITGGTVFVMMLTYYFNLGGTAIAQMFNASTQEDLTSITEIIEYDVRKAGYGVTDSVAFATADSNKIAIRGDFDNDGLMDTVSYWISSTKMPESLNPAARILYRKVGGTTVRLTPNAITEFKILYYDGSKVPTTDKKQIKFIRVAMNMECKLTYENQTAGEYWERVMKPQNVR